jgi:rod shape determining protein RodA
MAMIEPSQRENTWRNADPAMLVITLLLLGFGLVTIYSADGRVLGLGSATFKQALFAGLGFALMAVLAALDYRVFRALSIPIYLGGLALLALVLKKGLVIAGAQRWFDLGFTTFQPSEPAKLATIIALAAFISFRGLHMRGPISFGLAGLIAVVPAALVFIEPDLGTALIFAAIWLGVIMVTRTRWIYLLLCLVAIAPAIYFAWNGGFGHQPLFQDYQKDRITCFLHPQADQFDFCSNVVQARITIGQAGLIGHRFADAAQINERQRLAVSTTDFAFAHATGNFGFIGALALFALYLLLIWRYLRVARLARDEFGQLIAIGATALLFFHAFVNIGMNVNLLPVVGIPLPFISAGGTPLVTMLAMQGILQSILMHRQRSTFGQKSIIGAG